MFGGGLIWAMRNRLVKTSVAQHLDGTGRLTGGLRSPVVSNHNAGRSRQFQGFN